MTAPNGWLTTGPEQFIATFRAGTDVQVLPGWDGGETYVRRVWAIGPYGGFDRAIRFVEGGFIGLPAGVDVVWRPTPLDTV